MTAQTLYDYLASHLDSEIPSLQTDKMGRLKRVWLPVPEEYGGGHVTGYGYAEAVRNLIAKIKPQLKDESDMPTFRESWEAWIELKEGQERAPSTISNYKYLANNYLLPFFGEMSIDQINPDDIQKFYNSTIKKSKSIATQCSAILSGIFDRAVRLRQIPQNIMLYKYEKSTKTKKKVVLQDDDLIEVIQSIDNLKDTEDIRDYLYFCFLAFSALRRGEILGLRWKDIDFVGDTIDVRNNVTFPSGQNAPNIGEPKDGSSGRVHLQTELKRRLEPFKGFGNSYVLPYSFEEQTKPMTRSMFTKMWNRITSVIDLKGATSHSFRASYATMMNAHCDHIDPKALQGALRHKTPDLAIKVYTRENKNKTKLAEEEYDAWLQSQLAK